MDGGMLAIGLLAIIIIYPSIIFAISRYNGIIKYHPLAWGLLAAYLLLVLEYSKSGDFYKARSLFVVASVLIGYIGMESRSQLRTKAQSHG